MRLEKSRIAFLGGLALISMACSKGTNESTPPGPASAPPASESASGPPPALPPGHPPTDGMQKGPSEHPAGAVIAWTVPAGWKEEPSSGMRYATYKVSGVDGDPEDAECAVFYFGAGQGGSPKDNASRWVSQFSQPDGKSSEERAKIEVKSVNGKQTMFVEVGGTYAPSMMGQPGGEPKKDYALIGAIVSGPDAPWFFKLTGPRRTVDANRAAFNDLIASIH